MRVSFSSTELLVIYGLIITEIEQLKDDPELPTETKDHITLQLNSIKEKIEKVNSDLLEYGV